MSGFEAFAVAGAVASIISAFEAARKLFGAWKRRKKSRSASGECQEVEKSLQHNPESVERRYDDGYRRLGPMFARGDAIAHNSLLLTVTQFNQSLMECLKLAVAGKFEPDLSGMWKLSEATGQRTTSDLTSLFQRLAQAGPIPQGPSQPSALRKPRQSAEQSVAATKGRVERYLSSASSLSFRTQAPLPPAESSDADDLMHSLRTAGSFSGRAMEPSRRSNLRSLARDLYNIDQSFYRGS